MHGWQLRFTTGFQKFKCWIKINRVEQEQGRDTKWGKTQKIQ